MTGRRLALWTWVVLSLVWLAAVTYLCLRGWPRMPLDVSANDPATRAAYDRAVAAYVTRHAAMALVPPLVVLALGWLAGRLRSG